MTTSQNATAPKLRQVRMIVNMSLTTSQNATAPKPCRTFREHVLGLTTSQNATAPKLEYFLRTVGERLTTSQNATAPKLPSTIRIPPEGLTTSQNATAPKPDSDEMAQYVEQRLGVSVTDGFNDLPLEIKKEIVAGVVDATKLYGAAELNTITVMASRANDGAYNPASATIKINKNASSPYLAGFHEAIHGIDAKKSAEMPQFSKIHTGEEYNLHSAKVLKEARKAVGLSRFSKKYEDAVIELMGWDPSRYALDGKKPFEVVAYALDYEAQGFSNALSKAIAERF